MTKEDRIIEAAFKIHNTRHPAHVKKIAWHSCFLIFPGLCECMEEGRKIVEQQIKAAELADGLDFHRLFVPRIP